MVIVQQADFDTAALVAQQRERTAGKAGALVTFTGYVRDYAPDQATQSLFLEHYPGMCEREITEICETPLARGDGTEVMAVHRHRELPIQAHNVFLGGA